jgi:hypothetical protein
MNSEGVFPLARRRTMKANRIAITSIATVATIGIGIAAIFGFNAANDGERIDDTSTPSEAWDTVYDTPFDQHRTEPDTRPIADVNDNKVSQTSGYLRHGPSDIWQFQQPASEASQAKEQKLQERHQRTADWLFNLMTEPAPEASQATERKMQQGNRRMDNDIVELELDPMLRPSVPWRFNQTGPAPEAGEPTEAMAGGQEEEQIPFRTEVIWTHSRMSRNTDGESAVRLTWQLPSQEVTGYSIMRNDGAHWHIVDPGQTELLDAANLHAGTFVYDIEAYGANGELLARGGQTHVIPTWLMDRADWDTLPQPPKTIQIAVNRDYVGKHEVIVIDWEDLGPGVTYEVTRDHMEHPGIFTKSWSFPHEMGYGYYGTFLIDDAFTPAPGWHEYVIRAIIGNEVRVITTHVELP